MSIIIKNGIDDDLTHDQSAGLTDSDIAVNDGSLLDLESKAPAFYALLNSAGLVDGGADPDFAVIVGAAESVDDFVTVDEPGTVNSLYFSKNDQGDALDGQIWTYDTGGGTENVTTVDGSLIYIYSINNGQVMIASTEDPATMLAKGSVGGSIDGIDSISDFDASKLVMAAYILPSADNTTAEIYTASFQPVSHFDNTDHDDTVDLSNNLWISATATQDFFFDSLESTKFLFGVVGDDVPGEESTKLFVIGQGYNVDDDEERVNGNKAGAALNTSQAGQLPLVEGKVATIGVDNQTINDGQGVFLMLVESSMTSGAYQDGDDLDFSTVLGTSSLGYTITQAVGNDPVAMSITGYFDGTLTAANTIQNTGDLSDATLGTTTPIQLVSVSVIDGLGNTVEVKLADGTNPVNDLLGRTILIEFDAAKTTATISGLEAADTIVGEWASDINHELVATVSGSVDIGKVSTSEGKTTSANVGASMYVDDDGPAIDIQVASGAGLTIALDESIVSPRTTADESGSIAAGADDTLLTAPDGTNPFGRVTTGDTDVSGLFKDAVEDAGTDGKLDRVDAYTLSLTDASGSVITDPADFDSASGGFNGVATTLDVSATVSGATPDATIHLFRISSTVIEGRVDLDGDGVFDDIALVFTMLDGGTTTPKVQTDQILAIKHGDNTDHDDSATLGIVGGVAASGIGVVKTSTLRDLDTDVASDSETYNMTGDVKLEDDGPIMDIELESGAGLTIALDESIVSPQTTADESGSIAAGADDTLLTAPDGTNPFGRVTTGDTDVSGLFKDAVEDAGTDGKLDRVDAYTLSLTDVSGSVITDPANFNGASVGFNGVATTLAVSADLSGASPDATIHLFRISSTVIEGRVDLDGDDFYESTALVFTMLDGGTTTPKVQTDQILAIEHGDTTDHDESATLGIVGGVAASGIGVVKTSTLRDLDTDVASDLATYNMTGDVELEDDGPIVDVTTDVDTGDLAALSRNLDETIDPDADATADGADTYSSLDIPDNNGDLDDVVIGGVANLPIWETNPDGFSDATSEAIGKLETTAGGLSALFVDNSPADFVDYGTDGEGDLGSGSGRSDVLSFVLDAPAETTVVATLVDGEPIAALTTVAERTVWLVKTSDTVVEGRTAGADGIGGTTTDEFVILRITLTNADTPASATLVYEQFAPVVHPTDTLYDEAIGLLMADASDELKVRWTTTAQDKDDDSASDYEEVTLIDSANTVLSIDDDGPKAASPDPLPLEEDDLTGQSVGLNEDGSVGAYMDTSDLSTTITLSGIETDVSFALKSDATSLADLAAANAGLKSQGGTVLFDVTGNTLTGYVEDTTTAGYQSAEDRTVFTFTLTAAGLATLTIMDQLDHPSVNLLGPRNELDADDDIQEEDLTLTLTKVIEARDRDGDIVELDANFLQYAVEDDIPDIGDSGANNVASGAQDKIPNAVIDFASSGADISQTESLQAYLGSDEGGSSGVTITAFDDTITYGDPLDPSLQLLGVKDATGKIVNYYQDVDKDGNLDADDQVGGVYTEYFRMTIDDSNADSTQWTYTWEAFQDPPPVSSALDFNAIKAGGPKEILRVPTVEGGTYVHFDSLFIINGTSSGGWTPSATVNIAESYDNSNATGVLDIPFDNTQLGNPDALGFGHSDGQASQFNHNEGFWAAASSDPLGASLVPILSLSFAVQFIGNAHTVNIDWVTIDDGVVEALQTMTVNVNTGQDKNVPVQVDLYSPDGDDFDAIYVRTFFSDGAANKGVRLLEFEIGEPQPTEDQALDWTVTIADFEGDTDVATFSTGIDGTLSYDDGLVSGVTEGVV